MDFQEICYEDYNFLDLGYILLFHIIKESGNTGVQQIGLGNLCFCERGVNNRDIKGHTSSCHKIPISGCLMTGDSSHFCVQTNPEVH